MGGAWPPFQTPPQWTLLLVPNQTFWICLCVPQNSSHIYATASGVVCHACAIQHQFAHQIFEVLSFIESKDMIKMGRVIVTTPIKQEDYHPRAST